MHTIGHFALICERFGEVEAILPNAMTLKAFVKFRSRQSAESMVSYFHLRNRNDGIHWTVAYSSRQIGPPPPHQLDHHRRSPDATNRNISSLSRNSRSNGTVKVSILSVNATDLWVSGILL